MLCVVAITSHALAEVENCYGEVAVWYNSNVTYFQHR